MLSILWVLLGLVGLYFGGEALVGGSSRLARAFGIPAVVIGLTVVAFGTSAPELAASLTAVLQGAPSVAFGNVVGSNIANIGLILALAALLMPIRSDANVLRRDLPLMIVASLVLVLVSLDGRIGRVEGAIFLASLVIYLWWLFRGEKETGDVSVTTEDVTTTVPAEVFKPVPTIGLIVLGLVGLVVGAQLLVTGATTIARSFGVSELIIGLTLVAVGTSLPELATSVVAALRKESDIALGNVIGSNLFNILGILGVTSLVRPITPLGDGVLVSLLVMVGIGLLLVPLLLTGRRLARWEGGLLLAIYAVYLVTLVT